jgi:hypothetical protein
VHHNLLLNLFVLSIAIGIGLTYLLGRGFGSYLSGHTGHTGH